MTTTVKNKVVTCMLAAFFLILCLGAWFRKADAFSDSERRSLQQFPVFSVETVFSGKFMEDFERYALDQFPFREQFRSWKAYSVFYLFRQKDNHGVYLADGYAAKLEYPMNQQGIERAAQRFWYVYDKYLADTKARVYVSVIPDKNAYLAGENGYPSMNYQQFYKLVEEKVGFAEYIDITEILSIEDYYRTDTHWRQEKLLPVAEVLGAAMNVKVRQDYRVETLDHPFYGVYYGQSALPLDGEEIRYFTSDTLENCKVYDFQNEKYTAVYDQEKACGKDPYEMFLSGPLPLLTLENPYAESGRELILFRDSFGSSIAPLLAEEYDKITLVDIRYIHPDLLGKYIDFQDQDVLFLYSTLVLNHGETIK